jgi:hypothetical protein
MVVKVLLNNINPFPPEPSRQLILILAAGEDIIPDKAIEPASPATEIRFCAAEMTVVPSQSLQIIFAAPAVSSTLTEPETNQVPDVPWAILGPVKYVPEEVIETLLVRMFDAVVNETAIAPVLAVVP